MEPRQSLSAIMEPYRPSLEDGPLKYFDKAYTFAMIFYKEQIDQIWSVEFDKITPEHFFREYIWVVHATGFNAKVVASMMPRLVEAYGTYKECANNGFNNLYVDVSKVCANHRKAKAVWNTAKLLFDNSINEDSWQWLKDNYFLTPNKLQNLEFIGPITCYHLARNIGLLEFVKPDLHLVRMAKYWKVFNLGNDIEACEIMCKTIQKTWKEDTGSYLPLGIIDLILWYAASTFGTKEIRVEGER